ncbi:MAG: serine hydroxymethyltransferase [Candidatus Nomurabacteria bacterium]|jgi:glycine hydroxymethyltransferase|nr:serine hydroxymethyltransferase [Candidatus Nomurabacteria bacterium]
MDKQVFDLIAAEEARQREGLELIPSENYVSRPVLTALGSVFTNKYSEGYPGKRYYGGQVNTDKLEQLTIDRAKKLFGADHANVQPHSGAQANMAVYNAWCEPGDTILGMDLGHGGHLTHGSPVTQAAQVYNFVRYKTLPSGEIDYAEVEKLATEHQPKILLVGYSAYSQIPDFERLAAIGQKVGALLMADMAHVAGLIAGGAHPNPLQFGFQVMTTTTHKTLRGPRGGLILSMGTVSNPWKKPEKTIENIPTLIDRSVFPGTQGGPLMNTIAAKAVSFYEAARPEFAEYAQQVVKNAAILAAEFDKKGYKLVAGGTENHLILIDMMASRGIDGGVAQEVLDEVGLTTNKNAIPDDSLPPATPSGLRLGSPAVTSRGMKEPEMVKIADLIDQAITNRENPAKLAEIHVKVRDLTAKFPLPSDL